MRNAISTAKAAKSAKIHQRKSLEKVHCVLCGDQALSQQKLAKCPAEYHLGPSFGKRRNHENRLGTISGRGFPSKSHLYDADGQRVRKTSNGVNTYYPNQTYEQSGATITKYYYFNGQRVSMRTNTLGGWAHYDLHGDHLGSTVLTTNQGNAVVSNERYYAYGRTRTGGISLTDHKFTGQKCDGTGLLYFNARYYDPDLGQFLSPDTLVPDPGNLFDYNRYMYTRGNPMKYNDPTGHYSNDEIMQHFGCDSWGCVEANFNEGGSLEDAWGWLNVLQAAHDGDTVSSTMLTQIGGQAGSTNTSLLGAIQRGENGRIGIHLTTFVGADYSQSALNGTLDGDAFAQFAKDGDVGMYGVKGGVTYNHNAQAACYTGMQCTTQALDAASTAASAVAAICLGTVVGTPCAGAAGFVSTVTGATGTVLTGISAYQGEASWWDVGVGIATTGIGGYKGTVGKGTVGVVSSLFQWWYDQ